MDDDKVKPLSPEEEAQRQELNRRAAKATVNNFVQYFKNLHWLTQLLILYAILGLALIFFLAAEMPTRSPTVVRNYALSNIISIGFNVLFVWWWYTVKNED